jgi:hypothetical protein
LFQNYFKDYRTAEQLKKKTFFLKMFNERAAPMELVEIILGPGQYFGIIIH